MTSTALLTAVEHGVPSGNYDGSSEFFTSDAAPAAGFYQGQGSVQTMTVNVTNFTGSVTIQATLNSDSKSAAWFDIDSYGPVSDASEIHSASVIGNFVWIRALVQGFESGTINSVILSY
jgi:hypothetical protein